MTCQCVVFSVAADRAGFFVHGDHAGRPVLFWFGPSRAAASRSCPPMRAGDPAGRRADLAAEGADLAGGAPARRPLARFPRGGKR
jgi:hypothetical protein